MIKYSHYTAIIYSLINKNYGKCPNFSFNTPQLFYMKLTNFLLLLLLSAAAPCFLIQDPTPPLHAYNPELAKTYVAYGILAYCPKKCLQSWSCQFSTKYPKLVNVTHISNEITLAAAYVGYQPQSKIIIVSWRGSANAENWIEDFTFEMEPFAGCKKCYIHVGFNIDYHLNERKITEHVNLLLKSYPVEKIIFTGHSLGAAMASINAVYLALSGPKVPLEVYNFGSPRFGNENLAQYTKLKVPGHFRLVHNRDLIPHLPPSVEYKHAANQIFFNEDMSSYKICDDSGQDPSCSNKFFPEYNANDHNFYFVNLADVKC